MSQYKWEYEEEAQKILNSELIKLGNFFCPLSRALCQATKCMAFDGGKVYLDNDKQYRVAFPGCGSPMITGTVHVDR